MRSAAEMRSKLAHSFRLPFAGAALGLALGSCSSSSALDTAAPLPSVACSAKLTDEFRTAELDVVLGDRTVPVTIFYPAQPGRYPLIGFSHGAFAAPDRYSAMLGPLAAGGFVVVAPMHIDSEEMQHEENASSEELWATRNADMRMVFAVPGDVRATLTPALVEIDASRAIALGHSFGTMMSYFAGGATLLSKSGEPQDLRAENVAGVVAFSPPPPLPGTFGPEAWSTLAVPSLTLTGDADVLPGFIDEWTMHLASFENAPAGTAELWTGEGVNHYFGGMFGRPKPADDASRLMFDRAMAQTLGFIERTLNHPQPCEPGQPVSGEKYASN